MVFPLSLTSPSRVDFECSSTALTAATRQEYRKAFMPLRNWSVERSAARATSVSMAWRRASQAARLSASSEESAEIARSFVSASAMLTCRSEEHTSELQSHLNLVCRLLLE